MSSFVRAIERSQPHLQDRYHPTQGFYVVTVAGRRKPFNGRGANLGVDNTSRGGK